MRIILLLCLFSPLVKSANILGLMSMPSYSHHIWNSALLYNLAEKGHNITVLSVDLPKNFNEVPKNVHFVHLERTYEMIYKELGNISLENFFGMNGFAAINMNLDFAIRLSYGISQSKGFKVLMDYPDDHKFDLVIYDHTIGPYLLGFLHKFHYPPLIGLSAFINPPITTDIIGHHYFSGYIPYWSTTYDTDMTFWERLHNTMIYAYDSLWVY